MPIPVPKFTTAAENARRRSFGFADRPGFGDWVMFCVSFGLFWMVFVHYRWPMVFEWFLTYNVCCLWNFFALFWMVLTKNWKYGWMVVDLNLFCLWNFVLDNFIFFVFFWMVLTKNRIYFSIFKNPRWFWLLQHCKASTKNGRICGIPREASGKKLTGPLNDFSIWQFNRRDRAGRQFSELAHLDGSVQKGIKEGCPSLPRPVGVWHPSR